MRLLLYTGKGGVGKTATSAATAACAAERGRRTLVASVDAAHSLGDVLESRLGPDPVEVAPRLFALEVDARVVLARHWGSIRSFLTAFFEHQGIDAVVADELALLPGAEEVAALLAVEELAGGGDFDLVVVDCAPTDSTLRLLTLPDVAHRALRLLLPILRTLAGVATPLASRFVSVPLPSSRVFRDAQDLLYRKLQAVRDRMLDPGTSVRIVLTPERMVIDEARRLHTELALFEVPCDAMVMNRLLPDEAAAEAFFRDWGRVQEERRAEVEALFAPLPVLAAPLRDQELTGIARLRQHGAELFADAEPDAVLCRAPRIGFERAEDGFQARVPLPGASADDLDVAVVDGDLVLTMGGRRRAIALPRRVVSLSLASAVLRDGSLVVRFAASGS